MDEPTKPGSMLPDPPPGGSQPEPPPSAEATIWGGERPPAPPEDSASAPTERPPSPWWPESTGPPPLEPPPGRRGRVLIVVLATILILGGAAAGIVIATTSNDTGSTTSPPPVVSPSPLPTGPGTPGTPTSFTAKAQSGGEVELTWAPVQSDVELTGYNLLRDGVTLKVVGPTVLRYQDLDVVPEHTYVYTIEAVSSAGPSQQVARIVITPKAPALKKARVTGGFTITGHFTDENFTNRDEGEKYNSFWSFTPVCSGTRACNVKTSGEGEGSKKVLKLKKGKYNGTVPIPDGGQCGSLKLTETQIITFKVTKAKFIDGVWTATKISGDTRFDVPASPGCQSGFGVVAFTGNVAT